MKNKFPNSRGFTSVELVFVTAIFVLVTTVLLSLWLYSHTRWSEQNKVTNMRSGLSRSLETVRDDLRLSTSNMKNKMRFYPEGPGPYSAITFPVISRHESGFLDLDAEDKIIPERTVVYHLYEEEGSSSLRRTVIDPRDNSLTGEERQQKLNSIVEQGEWHDNAHTDKGFLAGVEIFEILSLSSGYDFYTDSSVPVRKGKVVFGWAVLEPGSHDVRFEITGKHENSIGYGIGLDNLSFEPAGTVREIEFFGSEAAEPGSFAYFGGSINRVKGSVWSNKSYLEFDASGVGSFIELTDHYDLWRESSFSNCSLDRTIRTGDANHIELDLPPFAFGSGNGNDYNADWVWRAAGQTGDSSSESSKHEGDHGQDGTLSEGFSGEYQALSIRNLVKGLDESVAQKSDLIRVSFYASSEEDLVLKAAYITVKDPGTESSGLENKDPAGQSPAEYHLHQQLFFENEDGSLQGSTVIPRNEKEWSAWSAYPLGDDKDFFVTIALEHSQNEHVWKYENEDITKKYSYALGFDDVAEAMEKAGTPHWQDADWSSSDLWVVGGIDTAGSYGTVTSKIVDTALVSPSYKQVKWTENKPAGTDIKMKVRSSPNEAMHGSNDWDSISASGSNPGSLGIGSGRFLQFKAYLSSDIRWRTASGNYLTYEDYISLQRSFPEVYQFPSDPSGPYAANASIPSMDNVTIDWDVPSSRLCRITGYVAQKNDYGQAVVTIDGKSLMSVLQIRIRVEDELGDRTFSQEGQIIVDPLNTGKFGD